MKNGNLVRVKKRMRSDTKWSGMLMRNFKDDILIDLDGDGQPDIALVDMLNDGDINTFAFDLTGNGDFNLYFIDVDDHEVGDIVFQDENGDETDIQMLGIDRSMKYALANAAAALKRTLSADEFNSLSVENAMFELNSEVKRIQKVSKATTA